MLMGGEEEERLSLGPLNRGHYSYRGKGGVPCFGGEPTTLADYSVDNLFKRGGVKNRSI
jgi:hypothetical protein